MALVALGVVASAALPVAASASLTATSTLTAGSGSNLTDVNHYTSTMGEAAYYVVWALPNGYTFTAVSVPAAPGTPCQVNANPQYAQCQTTGAYAWAANTDLTTEFTTSPALPPRSNMTFTIIDYSFYGWGPFDQTWASSCPTVTISPSTLPDATVGSPYSQQLTASPAGSYTFSYSGSFPPGLSLGASSGLIGGFPTASGSFSFTVTATGTSGCSGSQNYTLTVDPAPGGGSGGTGGTKCDLTLKAPAKLYGYLGESYSGTFVAHGGRTPYKFATISQLPTGLNLNRSTGEVSGQLKGLGTFIFSSFVILV